MLPSTLWSSSSPYACDADVIGIYLVDYKTPTDKQGDLNNNVLAMLQNLMVWLACTIIYYEIVPNNFNFCFDKTKINKSILIRWIYRVHLS